MIKIEDGKITQTSLPRHGYIDGRFVSTMSRVPKEDLLRNGWHDAEHDKPAYDPAYEKLSQPNYIYDANADKVTATYTVIELAEAVLKRRVDELESVIEITADKTTIAPDEVATVTATIPFDAEYCFITVNGPPAEKADVVGGEVVRAFSASEAGLYKVEFWAGNKTSGIIIEVVANA